MTLGNLAIPVDLQDVILLLLIGAALKHFGAFKKVNNNYIPAILIVIGVIVELITNAKGLPDTLMQNLITGLASALAAVGLHSSGKNIFANGIFEKLFYKQNFGDLSEENDEESEDKGSISNESTTDETKK